MIATNITNQFDDGRLQPRAPDLVLTWETALDHLSTGLQAWLTVTGTDGTPVVRPVLAVMATERLHVASSPRSRKASSLEAGTMAALATRTEGIDWVWTGTPDLVTNGAELDRVVSAYREQHGWDVVRDGTALDAPYGAPCAGPPPYVVYRIDPVTVHAFGTSERVAKRSTRWDFGPAQHPTGSDARRSQ